MKRIRGGIDPRAGGMLRAPPCRFLLPSDCVSVPKYANTLEPFCSVRFVQRVCWCVLPPCHRVTSDPRRCSISVPMEPSSPVGRHMALMPCHHPRPSASSLHGEASAASLELEESADLGASPVCRQSSLDMEPLLEGAAFSQRPYLFAPVRLFLNYGKDTHVVEG